MIKRDTLYLDYYDEYSQNNSSYHILRTPLDMFIKYDPIYHGFNYLFENFDKIRFELTKIKSNIVNLELPIWYIPPSLLNKYIVHMIDDNKISISTRQMSDGEFDCFSNYYLGLLLFDILVNFNTKNVSYLYALQLKFPFTDKCNCDGCSLQLKYHPIKYYLPLFLCHKKFMEYIFDNNRPDDKILFGVKSDLINYVTQNTRELISGYGITYRTTNNSKPMYIQNILIIKCLEAIGIII